MPYQNIPSYGKRRIRPQPLSVVYARDEVRRRPVTPRSNRVASQMYYTPRRPAASPVSGRNQTFARNVQPQAARLGVTRFFKKSLVTVLAIALVGFTFLHASSGSRSVAHAITSSAPIAEVKKLVDPTQSAEAQAAAEQQARMDTYKTTVNNLIAAHPDENIAVSTADVHSDATDESMTLGDQGTFTAASTAKLITAITYLHQVELGKTTLSKSIQGQKASSLLQNMIVNSDNDAWETLNGYLTHGTLVGYMGQIGLTEYDPADNTLLPADMTLLMKKFYLGQLVDKDHTDLLLSYMQQANKREYIVADVPSGYTVYHKAGWFEGLMHDVAIITNGQKTIVLAIYTYDSDGVGDNSDNQALFKKITEAAMQAYFTN